MHQKLLVFSNTKDPLCKMCQVWLCLGTTAQYWSQALKLSIKLPLEFAAISVNERHRQRGRQTKVCVNRITYRMESVTAAFLLVNLTALDGLLEFPTEPSDNSSSLGMSMEDDINHCVAAAYCRHSDFSLSTFCI